MKLIITLIFLISSSLNIAVAGKSKNRKSISSDKREREEKDHLNQIRRTIFGKKIKKKEVVEMELRYSSNLKNFWIKYFTGRERERFTKHMKNGKQYKKITDKIFRKHNLPTDLFYVGLIESGYNSKIRSRAGAVGPWQFVKGTGKHYGLRIDHSVDERRNIFKATEAAAKYFKDLYNIFGSWELALCAYNKGEYGIIRAIRKGNTRDYRELIRKRLIPKETMYYIPKIVAAKDLYNNPRKYKLPIFRERGKDFLEAKEVKFYSTVNIKKYAKKIGVAHSELTKLNPDLKHRTIRVRKRSPFKIFIPNKANIRVANKIAKKTKDKNEGDSSRPKYYRVKSGDNLYNLAKRFKVNAKALANKNRLRTSIIKVGQKLYIPEVENSKKQVYRVRRGDSLIEIARRFGTSVKSIRDANELKNSVIYPRQKLEIPSNS